MSDLLREGHAALARLRPRFSLPLVVYVEEGMIFHNGTAQRTSKLVIVERVLGSCGIEEISRPSNRTGAVIFQR